MRGNLGLLAACVATAVACSRSQPPRSSGSARADSVASTTGTPAVTPLPQPAPNAQRPDSAAAKASPRAADSTAPSPTPRAPRVLPSETVLTGKVVAGGLAASPVTSLQIEGGKPTSLVGPLEPELRRLGGAIVWVSGAPGGGKPNASFTVSRYEIVSIDGVKPLVGRVATRDGALVLAMERDTLTLVSAPAVLANKTGAKVWIVGRRSGSDLTPQTYGVIREP
jgi:hypothetical protein